MSAANSETGHDELYLIVAGTRVAYRGHPGTPDAGKWVSLVGDSFVDRSGEPEPSDSELRARLGLPDDAQIVDGGEIGTFPEPSGRHWRG